MTEVSAIDLEEKIANLRKEHRDLEQKLDGLVNDPLGDDLKIQELKKQKLFIKDSIESMQVQLRV